MKPASCNCGKQATVIVEKEGEIKPLCQDCFLRLFSSRVEIKREKRSFILSGTIMWSVDSERWYRIAKSNIQGEKTVLEKLFNKIYSGQVAKCFAEYKEKKLLVKELC